MWLYVLALAFVCEAHVRLIHKTYFTLPIRNALTASGDGTLSVAGPCGGLPNWGNRSYYSNVTVGDNITLVYAYNGGHQSPTLNMLRVSMICNKPLDETLFKTTTVATSSSALVNASASSTAGYDVWVVIPPIQSGVNGEFCTISVLDVRNWGGCIDVKVLPVGGVIDPPSQNALTGKNIAGVYTFTKAQCTVDSPGCCCASGSLTVVHVTGATVASGTLVINKCDSSNSTATRTLSVSISVALAQQATTLASLRATVVASGADLTFQVSAGATANTLVMTDDSAVPQFCGVAANLGGSTPPPSGGGDSSSAPAIGSGIMALMLVALFSQ